MPMRRSRRGLPREHPPIYFGFGSISVESAADMLAMIGAACAQLGERALAEFDLTGKVN
jgi:UDP:flavonoid glycosyltransferase YjiC (YdhE family)